MNIPLHDYWRLLPDYLRDQRLAVAALSTLLLGAIGLQLVNPLVVRRFIDEATRGAAAEALLGAALVFLAVALVQQVATVATTWLTENVGWRATNGLGATSSHTASGSKPPSTTSGRRAS